MKEARRARRIAFIWFSVMLVASHQPAIAMESDVVPKQLAAREGSPLSGYYHVELSGSVLLYRTPKSRHAIRIVPTRSQWREFRREIDDIKIWEWRSQYSRTMSDAGDWSLHIEYANQSLSSRGYAGYPEEDVSAISCLRRSLRPYTRFLAAVSKLVGGRPFGYRVSPLEFHFLSELQLVATHPSPNRREQWADFRDPTGKVHRVWRRPSDCCARPSKRPMQVGAEGGLLREVTSTSVTLSESCEDNDGDWIERDRVMQKMERP